MRYDLVDVATTTDVLDVTSVGVEEESFLLRLNYPVDESLLLLDCHPAFETFHSHWPVTRLRFSDAGDL
jgi:hypothetical protein